MAQVKDILISKRKTEKEKVNESCKNNHSPPADQYTASA